MISASDLRLYVIRPVLTAADMWSPAAENLLLGTAAAESALGYYLHQDGGPALGIYQMEPATHDSLWDNYLRYRPELLHAARWYLGSADPYLSLTGNLLYATFMTRIKYFKDPQPLPGAEDIPGLAAYWKRVYNTEKGAGTEAKFVANYKRFVA